MNAYPTQTSIMFADSFVSLIFLMAAFVRSTKRTRSYQLSVSLSTFITQDVKWPSSFLKFFSHSHRPHI